MNKYAQFIRFAFIGGLNTLIHGAILAMCVEIFNVEVVLSNLIAFMAANVFSYFMNATFTFKVAPAFSAYLKFFLASLLSLGLTLLISWIAKFYGAHYLVGFLFVIVLVPLLSFFMMKFWAFSGSQAAR